MGRLLRPFFSTTGGTPLSLAYTNAIVAYLVSAGTETATKGVSQEFFAGLCDINRVHMSQIERGQINLTIATLNEPWFYCRFETVHPARHVRLVEADVTPELKKYLAGISGVVNYVNGTYSLFATAQRRRPERLLAKVERKQRSVGAGPIGSSAR